MKRTCRSSARMPRPSCHARDPMTDDVTGQRREALGWVGTLAQQVASSSVSKTWRGLDRHIPFLPLPPRYQTSRIDSITQSYGSTHNSCYDVRRHPRSRRRSPSFHFPTSPCRTSRILKLTALPTFVFTAYEAHQRDRRDRLCSAHSEAGREPVERGQQAVDG